MAFENAVVPEDWRSTMNVSLYRGKGEKTESRNYIGICLLTMDGNIIIIIIKE